MDKQGATAGVAWMTPDEWLRQYDEELRSLGSLPTQVVLMVAHAFHGDENPRAAAREYHYQTEGNPSFG